MKPYYEKDGVTIYHGDAYDVIPSVANVGAVITDPPYSSGGSFRGDRMRSTVDKYVQTGTLAYRPEFAGDNRDQRSYLAWCSLWMNAARLVTSPGGLIACFTDWRQLPTTTDAVQAAGWTWRGIAVWSKGYGRVNSAGFSAACEFVVWGTHGPSVDRDDYPPGVFETPADRGDERIHVAQKPVATMEWLCRAVTPGAVVLDPFMGSGTTLVAARSNGNAAIGCDSDERYCEIAARRLDQALLPFEANQ